MLTVCPLCGVGLREWMHHDVTVGRNSSSLLPKQDAVEMNVSFCFPPRTAAGKTGKQNEDNRIDGAASATTWAPSSSKLWQVVRRGYGGGGGKTGLKLVWCPLEHLGHVSAPPHPLTPGRRRPTLCLSGLAVKRNICWTLKCSATRKLFSPTSLLPQRAALEIHVNFLAVIPFLSWFILSHQACGIRSIRSLDHDDMECSK